MIPASRSEATMRAANRATIGVSGTFSCSGLPAPGDRARAGDGRRRRRGHGSRCAGLRKMVHTRLTPFPTA
ncbi:MAG: hypothetical protein OEV08_13475 [Nitrospira sp.]|nr:hypothetical protein [Nitrospira sp.]